MTPTGFCACECGGRTRIATQTRSHLGHVRGEPLRFIRGHNHRKRIADAPLLEEDRGYITPCLIWTGTLNADGYGRVAHTLVHRRAYEEVHGPIPAGLEIDHLCFVRPCVNGEHLEAVTHAENVRRAATHAALLATLGGHV